jgi:hypothetical protein
LYQLTKNSNTDCPVEPQDFIVPTTEGKEQREALAKIEKYNRRLERFLGISNSSDSEMPLTETAKGRPSYEVRQTISKLHQILVESWSKTCFKSHQAKLRLATFGNHKRVPGEETGDLPEFQNFDLLFSTHSQPPQWRQSKIRVIDR